LKYEVQLNQAPSRFYVVWTASAELFLHAGNMKFKIQHEELILFFHDAAASGGPGPPHYGGFTFTLRHTTISRTPLDK
jgi:hypothetical protein